MECIIPWQWQMVEFRISNVTLIRSPQHFWACHIMNSCAMPTGPVHGIIAMTKIWKSIYMHRYVFILSPYGYKLGISGCFLEKL